MTNHPKIETTQKKKSENLIQQAEDMFVKGDFPGAEAALRFAIQSTPENVELLIALGNILLKQNKIDEAEQVFENAANVAPGYFPAFTNLAAVQIIKGKTNAAKVCIQFVLSIDQNNPEAIKLKSYISALEEKGINAAAVNACHGWLRGDEGTVPDNNSTPIEFRKSFLDHSFPPISSFDFGKIARKIFFKA